MQTEEPRTHSHLSLGPHCPWGDSSPSRLAPQPVPPADEFWTLPLGTVCLLGFLWDVCSPLYIPHLLGGEEANGVMLRFSYNQVGPLLRVTGPSSLCAVSRWCQAVATQPQAEQGSKSPLQPGRSAGGLRGC